MAIKPIQESKKIIKKAKTATKQRATKKIEERREILQKEISKYVKDGYRVVSQSNTSAQLTRETGPSLGLACLLSLLLLLPAILYLIFYKSKENLYIEVDEKGLVQITAND